VAVVSVRAHKVGVVVVGAVPGRDAGDASGIRECVSCLRDMALSHCSMASVQVEPTGPVCAAQQMLQ
jgi:hypothetical protein